MITHHVDAFPITPDDTKNQPKNISAIYVGVTGDVVVTTAKDTVVTFKAVPAGVTIPIIAKKVMTASTATQLVGLCRN